MNIICGKQLSQEDARAELTGLRETILNSLCAGVLSREAVIAACDALSGQIGRDEQVRLLHAAGMSEEKAKRELALVKRMLSRGYLEERVRRELGVEDEMEFVPIDGCEAVRQVRRPLGVLLHIAAGNADALSVFSVIEGLLSENINILKLPGGGDEYSERLLLELIRLEPRIANKVLVFDFSSADREALERLADCADAVVVWGGDAAVAEVRMRVKPDTAIIEWGHKIGFAYVSGESVSDEAISGLAEHICDTNQLLCSSCQGIYVDTDSFGEVKAFAERFLGVLETCAARDPLPQNLFRSAQTGLQLYTEELESAESQKAVFRGRNAAVIAYGDSELTVSYQYRTVWVKPLPKERIVRVLKPNKNHLQTAALLCNPKSEAELEEALSCSGVVRITRSDNMSLSYCGMPHDGEFALTRYTKMVSIETARASKSKRKGNGQHVVRYRS